MAPFKGGYKITQVFGNNPDYYKPFGFAGHEGIDLIPADNDWNIYCVEGGVVLQDIDAPRNNYGKYCVIWNKANKRSWWYCHMEFNKVRIGQEIKQNDLVGKMGATGVVFGAHLHLGMRYSDVNANAINTDNGFKGFEDPLNILVELNKNPSDVCEKELDQARKDKDQWERMFKELQKKSAKEYNVNSEQVKSLQSMVAEQSSTIIELNRSIEMSTQEKSSLLEACRASELNRAGMIADKDAIIADLEKRLNVIIGQEQICVSDRESLRERLNKGLNSYTRLELLLKLLGVK